MSDSHTHDGDGPDGPDSHTQSLDAHTYSLGDRTAICHDHTVVVGVDPGAPGGDRTVLAYPIEAVPNPGNFPLMAGYIVPWSDKENLPAGWEAVGELGGQITENPGNPRSPIVPGVWIRKV